MLQTDTNWAQGQKYLSPKDRGIFLSGTQRSPGLVLCPCGNSGSHILTPLTPSLPSELSCPCPFSFILLWESQMLSTASSTRGSHGGWGGPARKNPLCDSSKHIQSKAGSGTGQGTLADHPPPLPASPMASVCFPFSSVPSQMFCHQMLSQTEELPRERGHRLISPRRRGRPVTRAGRTSQFPPEIWAGTGRVHRAAAPGQLWLGQLEVLPSNCSIREHGEQPWQQRGSLNPINPPAATGCTQIPPLGQNAAGGLTLQGAAGSGTPAALRAHPPPAVLGLCLFQSLGVPFPPHASGAPRAAGSLLTSSVMGLL